MEQELSPFSNFCGQFFHVFMGKKIFKNILDGENIFGIE
jgi:hypothetical protein